MSVFGDLIDALETHWRASVAGMAAGADGFERVLRVGHDDPNRPHVYAFNPAANARRLDGGALESSVTIQFEFWPARDQTQEEVSSDLDDLRAAIAADPTLGGLCIEAFVSFWGVLDGAGAGVDDRLGAVTVTCTVEE